MKHLFQNFTVKLSVWKVATGSLKMAPGFIQNPCEPVATFEKKWLPVPNLLFSRLTVDHNVNVHFKVV